MNLLSNNKTDELPERAPRGREAERILAAEQLAEFRHHLQTSTQAMERLAGNVINNVLQVETATFDATGEIAREFRVAAGCIEVSNPGAHTVTVSSAGPTGFAPTVGVGVYVVPAGTSRVVALASRQVTLYGTTGDTVSFQVFTAPPRPSVV